MNDLLGRLMIIVGIAAAIAAYVHGGRTTLPECLDIYLNHSGVLECDVGPYTGPLPIEFMAVDTASHISL